MAETFLTLMAVYDEETQQTLSKWQDALRQAGFTGTQTPDIPYHISLGSFALDQEEEAIILARRAAEMCQPVEVTCVHLGLFPGGKVLFAAPDMTPELVALHRACGTENTGGFRWTPHTTLLIDEPDAVARAIPAAVAVFQPFKATITRLHLCAFWPTREILAVDLKG